MLKVTSLCDCYPTRIAAFQVPDRSLWLSVSGSLELLDELNKCFLVHQAGILATPDDTDITEPELGKALVHEIHW